MGDHGPDFPIGDLGPQNILNLFETAALIQGRFNVCLLVLGNHPVQGQFALLDKRVEMGINGGQGQAPFVCHGLDIKALVEQGQGNLTGIYFRRFFSFCFRP